LAARFEINNVGANYFFAAISPDPPHFAQFFPSLAAATQHSCAQACPSFSAFTQQPAFLASSANAKLAVQRNATIRETNNRGVFILGGGSKKSWARPTPDATLLCNLGDSGSDIVVAGLRSCQFGPQPRMPKSRGTKKDLIGATTKWPPSCHGNSRALR